MFGSNAKVKVRNETLAPIAIIRATDATNAARSAVMKDAEKNCPTNVRPNCVMNCRISGHAVSAKFEGGAIGQVLNKGAKIVPEKRTAKKLGPGARQLLKQP